MAALLVAFGETSISACNDSLTADAPRGPKNALAQTPVHEKLRRANKLP